MIPPLSVTFVSEYLCNSSAHIHYLFWQNEGIDLLSEHRLGGEAAAYPYMETYLASITAISARRLQAQVIYLRLVAMDGAAGNAHFILSGKIGKVMVSYKIIGYALNNGS